jgi:hypothetical protein
MDYQTLTDVLGQSKAGAAPAPSLNEIITGIQSQYQAVPSMPVQSDLYGANRYISGKPKFGAIEKMPEYGTLNQLLGRSFVPSAFDKDVYTGIDSQRLSDLITTISNDYGNGSGISDSPSGTSGLASSPNIGTAGVTGLSMALSAITGVPVGLVVAAIGKQNIANAINSQVHSQNQAINQALVASQLGLSNTPANMAAIAAAIDSMSAVNPNTQAAVSAAQSAQGVSGATGGAASAAAASAAAAATAAGHSDAAIGAASQAAANATIGGASASEAAAAAADAANAAAADAADADGGGLGGIGSGGDGGGGGGIGAGDGGGGIGAGEGLATGGMVSKRHLAGPNPTGPDDGYAALKLGEYVIKQSSVDKYGTEIFDLINQGKISKKAINSLL